MSEQQSLFAEPERQRQVNRDPREQPLSPQQEYSGPYNQGQLGGEKIRPQPPRRRSPLAVIVLLSILLIGVGTAYYSFASSRAGNVLGAPIKRVFTVAGKPTLIVNNGNGRIHVHTSNGTNVTVEATKKSSGFGGGNDPQVDIRQSDASTVAVDVKSNSWSFFDNRRVDIDVTLPSSADLQLENSSGSIDIEDINGQIRARTGSGEITANGTGGQVQLATGSGSISVDDMKGQATLKTGSGDMDIKQAQLNGASSFQTGSGSIDFNGSLDPTGNYRFKTGSGSVDLKLPADSAFSLTTSTGSGSVDNEFGGNEVGAGPRAPLTIETGSGSIDVKKG